MRSLSCALALAVTLLSKSALAFCGFYVGGADTKLFNDATQVVLMRDGTRTVLSMQNGYQGPPEKFAMVVPVPVVLQKENVKTLPKAVFDHLDQLTAPRLVEYWEQDPCAVRQEGSFGGLGGLRGQGMAMGAGAKASEAQDLGVTVEARFEVGEYEIVILSAKDSSGLETWLRQEKYAIPAGAEPYFRPYVTAGSKFFVAKVDPTKVTFKDGRAELSPLRFHYDAPDFQLPVRLGLINSSGTQDLIIQVLAENKRYEPANYPSVTIPTNLDLAEGSKERFGPFYAALFDRTIEKNPKAIVTEYAWSASTCDPCPGPALQPGDLATLGADVLGAPTGRTAVAIYEADQTKQIAGTRDPQNDQIPARLRGRVRMCWSSALAQDGSAKGGRLALNVAWGPDGRVTSATSTKNDTGSDEVATCVTRAMQSGVFPASKVGGAMNVVYTLSSTPTMRARNFTITRLHARYGKDALGADIVFKEAPAIVGGREQRGADGALEHGATTSSVNNFQARYAIRHAWNGPVACKEPRRGIWGGPWPTEGGVAQASGPTAAQKLASVPRGGIDLASMVRSDIRELDVKATDVVPTAPAKGGEGADAGPATPGKRGCGACTTAPARTGDVVFGFALAAFVARMVRRRSRR